jgi:hypothetical protein
MRRRAVAVVATQGISPVMAMLVALVVALILLLAAPVKAQETTAEETTAEETTVLADDAADKKVEAETDNVSVKVDNGKVSVSTDDGSSSDDGTGQQSSVTVQQNQATDGTGSRASTGDVNIGATRTSNNFTIRIKRNGSQVDSDSTSVDDTVDFIVNERADTYNLQVTVQPQNTTTYSIKVDDCRGGGSTTTCNNPDQVARITDPDKSVTFDTTGNRFRVTYTVNFKNSNNNNNNNNNRHHHNRHHDRNRHHNRHHHDRNRFHNNRFFGGGAANQQYKNERIVEDRVIRETIPNNKGTLANTGGVPLTGAALLALASVGLGVSILRSAVRRDP